MSFTQSSLRRAGLGLLTLVPLAHAGCLDVEDDAVSDPDEEVASVDEAITPPAGECVFPALVQPPSWKNIPIFLPSLEVHTCDLPGADTDDPVQVRFQVAGSLYTYPLDKPGDDLERNQTGNYYFPKIGGALTQVRDLQAIHLEKRGNDSWCVDHVALKAGGVTIWQYEADENHPGVPLHSNAGNGRIWLDDQVADAPAPDVVFSDTEIHYGTRANHGPLDLEITTCDSSLNAHGNSAVAMTVLWSHDGIKETSALPTHFVASQTPNDTFYYPPSYWPFNSTHSQRLARNVSIENLDFIRLQNNGTDDVCIDTVKVIANGHVIATQHPRTSFGGDSTHKSLETLPTGGKVVETGTHVGKLGRPIAGANFAEATDVGFGASSSERPYCDPPRVLTHQALEGVIATIADAKMKAKAAFWGGSGTVQVTKKSADTLHVFIRFEKDEPGVGNARMWNDFDLTLDCDDTAHKLLLTPGPSHTDYDAPLLSDIIAWFASIDIGKEVAKAMPALDAQVIDIPGKCPTRSISANGDIHFGWDTVQLNNALCAIKASDWATVSGCLHQWGLAKK